MNNFKFFALLLLMTFMFSNNSVSAQTKKAKPVVKKDTVLKTSPKSGSNSFSRLPTIYKDENGDIISHKAFDAKLLAPNSNFISVVEKEANQVALRLKKMAVIGLPAKDFSGTLLDGKNFQLSENKGKVVVLNFWFIACAPCLKEIPELNEIVKTYSNNPDVKFVGVTFDSLSELTPFLKRRPFNYQQIYGTKDIFKLYEATSFPSHFIIGKDGKVQFFKFGYTSEIKNILVENIEKALKQN